MSQRKVEVLDYDPQWRLKFNLEAALLQQALGSLALKIEHIGSTAVIGLAAKPIIDILIEVSSLGVLDGSCEKLAAIGYQAKGENGIEGRRYFQKGGDDRTHHMHAFLSGDNRLIHHRAFKEYLIAHPDISKEYAAIKRQAAARCNHDSHLYMALKNEFIQQHLPLAEAWYGHPLNKQFLS